MDQQLDAFEVAWNDGDAPPSITDFLVSPTDQNRRLLLTELIKIDIDRRWQVTGCGDGRSLSRRIEDYLTDFPELLGEDEYLIELIMYEYRICRWRGEVPNVSNYLSRFPALADRLSERLRPDSSGSQPDSPSVTPSEAKFPHVAGYRILRKLGQGGMGIVYEARHVSLDRRVALKLLPGGGVGHEFAIELFLREARSAASLHHTNIVPVFDVGCTDDTHYYAMQLIEGAPLHDACRYPQI